MATIKKATAKNISAGPSKPSPKAPKVDPTGEYTKVQERTLGNMKKGGKLEKAKGGKWIQKAIKKPGALRKSLGAKPGKPIPAGKLAAAAKKSGKMGQRARLAITLGRMRKK